MSSRIVDNDPQRVGEWAASAFGGKWKDDPAIGFERDGELVAGVYYNSYTVSSIAMHGRVDGYVPPQWWWFIFAYPFNHLKVKRLSSIVSSANEKSNRLMKHLGFTVEATLLDYCADGDGIVYRMWRDECRFLGDKYGRRIK